MRGELVGVIRAFGVFVGHLLLFPCQPSECSNPFNRVMLRNKTLDYFRLTIKPENIDYPAGSRIFPRHESGPMLGHLGNMRLRRAGSSRNRLPSKDSGLTRQVAQNGGGGVCIVWPTKTLNRSG
jgi:hypothetical protein